MDKNQIQFDLSKKMDMPQFEVPTLMFLCHKAVYENQKQLKSYAESIPGLAIRYKEFVKSMKLKETRKHHRKCMKHMASNTSSDRSSYILKLNDTLKVRLLLGTPGKADKLIIRLPSKKK